jgi:antitoxin (DNA-binding transcriptional repressor) of toxin-antitoxin stability system
VQRIDIRDWKTQGDEVMRSVRDEGVSYAITLRGEVIARLEGGKAGEERRRESLRLWGEMKELAEELSESWSKGVGAVDAVREQRRKL